jgi:hypothetical protein
MLEVKFDGNVAANPTENIPHCPALLIPVFLTWNWSPIFGVANLCLAFFNLLPIRGSDGDRALACWEYMKGEGALHDNQLETN